MNPLSFLLLFLGLAGLASAESYRILRIETSASNYSQRIGPALKNPALLGKIIDGDVVKLTEKIVIHLDATGTGKVDQTHAIEYPQSYSAEGKPRELTSRKVGIRCELKKQPDGSVSFSYSSTTLEQWIFPHREKDFMQPLFNTSEFSTLVNMKLPESELQIIGATGRTHKISLSAKSGKKETRDAFTAKIFLIQRLGENAVP